MSPRTISEENLENREREILDAALSVMHQESVAGLTMDKVAALVPYSKGTLYNHFSCKEDLITSVCTLSIRQLDELFGEALEFAGNAREKMLALYCAYRLYARRHPTRFMLVVTAKSPAVMEKTSERRLDELYAWNKQLFGKLLSVVEQAITDGDLVLPPHLTAQQVTFANWSSAFGTISLLLDQSGDLPCRDGLSLERELFNNANIVLDGLGWRPLSTEQDFRLTIRRIEQELYPEEIARLTP